MILYAAELHRDCIVGSWAGKRVQWFLHGDCSIMSIVRKIKIKMGMLVLCHFTQAT